jgi:SPP1 family predicted phage head-tail adaptor
MQAGDLRSKVGFYAPVSGDDGYGNETTGFGATADFTVSANIKPRLGGETVLAGRLTGTNLVNVTVRKSTQTAAVTPAYRLKDERIGVIYNIRSIIDPDEGKPSHGTWLEMLCEKGVAA